MDRLTKKQRSYNMSQIRYKNTKPELVLFKTLKSAGYKFKKHFKIHGNPDAAFPEKKIAIFVDGEFWHGKDFIKWRGSISEFWRKKIGSNIKRDKKNKALLKKEGWKIIRLWGRSIVKGPDAAYLKVKKFIS